MADGKPLRITMLGDSLTAGFGLPQGGALPSRLESVLREQGLPVAIENAGIAGDTSAGGLARLPYILEGRPRALLLALGANDVLRGLSPQETFRNLTAIAEQTRARHVSVILLGMYAPPQLGEAYGHAVRQGYAALAERCGLPFYPFLLDGVALQRALNQPDGMHPNKAGVAEVARRLAAFLTPVLTDLATALTAAR